MSRTPIKIRIALLSALAAALAATLIGVSAMRQASAAIRADFDSSLGEEAAEAVLAVKAGLALSIFAHSGLGLYDGAGRLLDATDPAPPAPPEGQRAGEIFALLDAETGGELRGIVLPVVIGDQTDYLMVADSTAVLQDQDREIRVRVTLLILASTGILSLSAYVLAGLVLDPIERLRRSAEDLTHMPGGRRLDVPPARDAVRRLAETLNFALEQVDNMMETQRRFLAEAGHQLRTPLARMRADLDLARRPVRTHEEIVTALANLDDHVSHLTSLSDNLLSMLAPQGTRRALPRAITVQQILDDLALRSAWNASLHIDIPDDVGGVSMVTEPSMLVGVLSNLVDNAYRHGEPPVEVTAGRMGDGLAFSVRDHGPGIPAELRAQVMEPFHRALVATSGSGLGLSVVRAFAIRQGGDLIIEDADPGCRMVLRLPLDSLTPAAI